MSGESLLHFAEALAGAAEPPAAPRPEEQLHLVTFLLDREEYGIPVLQVREVVRVGGITRVPQAPAHVRGVTNLRGRILPVVELRSRLGLAPAALTPSSRIVVVEVRHRVLGLLVDAVRQVTKVPRASVVPPPEEVLTADSDHVTGVARWDGRLIILLELDRALQSHQ